MEIFYYTQIYYDYNYLSLHLFIFSVGIINLKKKLTCGHITQLVFNHSFSLHTTMKT